jgi:hypothetical protein
LVLVGAKVYGLTTEGGADGDGVMFSSDTSGKHFQVPHSFTGGQSDGAGPHGSLYLGGSTIYGMTSYDGAGNADTIFECNLCSFSIPLASLS